MQFTQKSALILLSFLLAISLAANVYSFGFGGSGERRVTDQTEKKVAQYKNELVGKENKIATLQEELDAAKVAAPVETVEVEQAATETETEPDELINTAQRFIEYAFETNPETYAARKKLALHYMTDSLYDTLYASHGVDEEQQKIAVDIKEVTVFSDGGNENEAIAHYTYSEEILSSGYKEEKELYVKLSFAVEGKQLKVAEIEPLENEYGGI